MSHQQRRGRGRGGGSGGRGQYQDREHFQQRGDGAPSSHHGGRGGGDGGSYHHQHRGRGGDRGGRGGGGGGGFKRGAPPSAPYFLPNCEDPYQKRYTQAQADQYQQYGWKKSFPDKMEDVVIQKRMENDSGKWFLKKIPVSVNHYLIESSKKEGDFPISVLYHYDIKYEILRKRAKDSPTGPEPSKRLKQSSNEGIKEATRSMQATSLQGGDDPSPSSSGGGGEPRKLPRHLTKAILDYLIPKLRLEYGHHAIATDGSVNLYSTRKFSPDQVPIPLQNDVKFEDLLRANLIDDENERGLIQVTFQPSLDKRTGEIHTIDTGAIAQAFRTSGSLKGIDISPEFRQTLEAACNAFVRSMPNFQYFSVGRSTFLPCQTNDKKPLGGGIQAWKGLTKNIAMGWKPYLNVDIANCAIILNKNVLEVLRQLGIRNPEDVTRWSSSDMDKAKDLLKTCKIFYFAGPGGKRSGAITDISRKPADVDNFYWDLKKKNVTIKDYFLQAYNVKLQHPKGPLLQIRKKALVPAELCTIKDGQSYNRKLDGSQTTEMLDFARKDPHVTKQDIDTRVKALNLQNNKVMQDLGLKVKGEMLGVQARVLVPPELRYGPSQRRPDHTAFASPTDGVWEIWRSQENFAFYRSATLEKWGILSVGVRCDISNLEEFGRTLVESGRKKNVSFKSSPIIHIDPTDRRHHSQDENAKDISSFFRSKFEGCKLVVVVLPNKGDPLYNAIKHAAEVEVGILTQCVASKNVFNPKMATCQNLILKINTKLNGINHVTVPPFDRNLASKFCSILIECPVMVLGADVTHAPPGSAKTVNGAPFIMPSYAAVTGSLDKTCMPFMTEVRAQRKADAGAAEVIQKLEDIVFLMLKKFNETSRSQENPKGILPRKIIYFRDGVGSGQFKEVLHHEMTAIRKACGRVPVKGYEPKITFITVQKRHKTRIFLNSQNGVENAPPGTVIDTEIVHPSETDFYLLSHFGMMGTSRPSRYHVLWDDSDFTQDQLQSLAYILCHQYARCTRSVKMPAPTYYAHLAADRAKKLCEGFEGKGLGRGETATDDKLNEMLKRHDHLTKAYPMHFI